MGLCRGLINSKASSMVQELKHRDLERAYSQCVPGSTLQRMAFFSMVVAQKRGNYNPNPCHRVICGCSPSHRRLWGGDENADKTK